MTDTEPTTTTGSTAGTQPPSPQPGQPAMRDALRTELEESRTKYHELANSLSDEDWETKSANPSWNVRQLMWHLAWAGGFTAQGVESCRKGKGSNPPDWIADFANTWITRIGSRSATQQSVRDKYDGAHEKVMEALAGVKDDEWQKGARVFNRDMTIEKTFRNHIEHFKEHEADIKKGLGRS
jgi:uncharacterized protein (TIGR03083 family)